MRPSTAVLHVLEQGAGVELLVASAAFLHVCW